MRASLKSDEKLTPRNILDWQAVLGWPMRRHEAKTIMAMEAMFRDTLAREIAFNEERRKPSK